MIGYDVTAPPPHSVVYPLLKKFPFVIGSVLDLPLLLNTIKQHKVQDVIHLAAIMAGAKERPVETVQVNVMGTVNVLEAGRILGLRRVICTSSFAAAGATGKDQSRLIPETEYALPVNARDGIAPYASTKLMCEELTYMYRAEHGVDAAIIRPARVYGPGLPRGRSAGVPIQAIFEKAIAGEAVSVPQGADTRIDLTYVKDEVRGFILTYRAANPAELAVQHQRRPALFDRRNSRSDEAGVPESENRNRPGRMAWNFGDRPAHRTRPPRLPTFRGRAKTSATSLSSPTSRRR